jgi:hypothetical protein
MKAILAVMALAMTTANAIGALGETPAQIESGRPYFAERTGDGDIELRWVVRYPKLGTKALTHQGIFRNGVAVAEGFWFNDQHPMTWQEIETFLKPYGAFKRSEVFIVENGWVHTFYLTYSDGSEYALVAYDKGGQSLTIWLSSVLNRSKRSPIIEPTPPPRVAPQPTPPLPQQEEDKNDCMVVATEMLNRVRSNSVWSKIVAFSITANSQRQPLGHAMTVWKPTWDGRVFAYDKNGTCELKTGGTDLSVVLTNIANSYAAKYHESYTLAGHYTDNPTVEGVGSSTSQSFLTEESRPGWLFSTVVWLIGVVVCFMKGKWRVATANIIVNVITAFALVGQWQSLPAWFVGNLVFNIVLYSCAIRLPYPWSWWAWRFYYTRPNKPSSIWKVGRMFHRWGPRATKQATAQQQSTPQVDEPIEAEWQKV